MKARIWTKWTIGLLLVGALSGLSPKGHAAPTTTMSASEADALKLRLETLAKQHLDYSDQRLADLYKYLYGMKLHENQVAAALKKIGYKRQ